MAYYPAERIVFERKKNGRIVYLVLWSGYPKEDACWVEQKDVTRSLLKEFKSPKPPMRLVLDSVSLMIFHIQRSLAAGTIRRNTVCMDFATDVFRFLFGGKGVDVGTGYKEYNLTDFSAEYFVDGWHANFDENGDGCAIDFPLKMKSCIQWRKVKGFIKTQGRSHSSNLFVERVYMLRPDLKPDPL